MSERVLILMSGGVDSSVAAALLVEQGHDVVGATLKLSPHHDPGDGRCCTVTDAGDARRVAHKLGIPHYTLDLVPEFEQAVVEPFRDAYLDGRTPIPCMACNHDIKFGVMLQRARALGCGKIATGHYLRVGRDGEQVAVHRGRYLEKDQTYFMCRVRAEAFANCLFPVGEMTKPDVRAYAKSLGLATANKPESMEICFVGQGDYRAWLNRPPREGAIVDRAGETLGMHQGYWNFTIGQRRGLGIAHDAPLYVIDILPRDNRVVVGRQEELGSLEVHARQLNLLAPLSPCDRVEAQIRYRHPAAPATIVAMDDGGITLRFHAPQTAVTPGQALALYRGDRLLGGAEIVANEKHKHDFGVDKVHSQR